MFGIPELGSWDFIAEMTKGPSDHRDIHEPPENMGNTRNSSTDDKPPVLYTDINHLGAQQLLT